MKLTELEEMSYEDKTKKFLGKNGRGAFKTKTPLDELPIIFTLGSGSHNPEQKVGVETADLVLWVKFLDQWFRPYGNFTAHQIREMIGICQNDNQIVALFELLSAKKEY